MIRSRSTAALPERLRLRPSSYALRWSFLLAFTILSALTQGPAITWADRRHPLRRSFRVAYEPAVPLRSGWSGHCLQIVERVLTTLRLRKTQDKCQSCRDRGALV
jgi:hypothetical protein